MRELEKREEKKQIIEKAAFPLVDWYREEGRSLPWREGRDAYKIWVSEIMLQQTRIEAVKPYYARFMEELPTIQDLAQVPQERLMKLWEGLGYYSRARNLKKCAMEVVEQYGGVLPADYNELKALPGIGPYTAGAIASIAYQIPVPAVDGNVLRVLSRLCQSREDIRENRVKKGWEEILLSVIPKECPGEFNEAIMELGETICIPNGRPMCEQCPVSRYCRAYAHGTQEELPVKTPKKARRQEKKTIFLFLIRTEEEAGFRYKVGICKRPEEGLLSGLYEFPSREGHLSVEEAAQFCKERQLPVLSIRETKKARHIFTHVEWDMTGYLIFLDEDAMAGKKREGQECLEGDATGTIRYVGLEELKDTYALPTAFQTYRKVVEQLSVS
jgi:A/G-specific adenine glycosylase